MKRTIPLIVIAISLMLTGVAFPKDQPGIGSWLPAGPKFNNVNDASWAPSPLMPGTTAAGVGGGGAGLGDVLIAPLYDVRNLVDSNLPGAAGTATQSQQTLFAIVNIADDLDDTTIDNFGVVARLRFREFMRSRECLDIDIPLTTHDVWVGELSRNPGGGFYLMSPDRYVSNIVNPYPDTTAFTTTTFTAPGLASLTYALEANAANAQQRCEYGYFEVIGEERVGPPNAVWTFPRLALAAVPNTATDRDVRNQLMGTVFIIRPAQAVSHQYNMTAIANFAIDARGIYRPPTTQFPTLPHQVQGEFPDGGLVQNPGAGGFNQLEALLSKRFVNFQYVTEGEQGGVARYDSADQTPKSTSVVITFPTKWAHYIQTGTFRIKTIAEWPGPTPFTGAFETWGDTTPWWGEVFNRRIWDRSENSFQVPQNPISPSPPGAQVNTLPFEVNVIGLYPIDPPPSVANPITAPVFRNNVTMQTASTGPPAQVFYSGWGWIDISPLLGFAGGDPRGYRQGENVNTTTFSYFLNFSFFNNLFTTYFGLPAVGIVMTEFYNDQVNGYFGNTVPWQYQVDWS